MHVKALAGVALMAQSRRCDALQPIKTAACLTLHVAALMADLTSLAAGPLHAVSLQTAHGQMQSVARAIQCSACASCITRNASTCVNLHRRFWADCDSSMCTHVAWIVVPAVQIHIKLVQALGNFTPHTFQLLHRPIKKWNVW